jgi:hypothetical protein
LSSDGGGNAGQQVMPGLGAAALAPEPPDKGIAMATPD